MPFDRPTLNAVRDRIAADIEARQPGLQLRYSPTKILGQVNADEFHIVYGWIDGLSRQYFPYTADGAYLEQHASWWGIARNPAVAAAGKAIFKAPIGTVIPAGTLLRRADGVEYKTAAEIITTLAEQPVDVEAVMPGAAGNAAEGVALSMVSPIAGVQTVALVDEDGLGAGAEAETDASLAKRLTARVQQPPQGGARHDYLNWALSMSGVTRAWVYPGELGIGTVSVRFMMDDDAHADGIPLPADVDTLQAWIDERRPVTADVTVVAPIAVPLDLTIHPVPDTPTIRTAIEQQIRDMIYRDAVPGGTILVSRIREAVSLATGESDNVITVPAANVNHATGEIAVPGVITWT